MKLLIKITLIFTVVLIVFVNSKTSALRPETLLDKIICVDPGHGGRDPGAVNNDVIESDIVMDISNYLNTALNSLGSKTVMTRNDNYDLSTESDPNKKRADLKKRVELVNKSKCDVLVSIHLNSISSSKWSGAQTFYFNRKSKKLAQSIQESLIKRLETDRKVSKIKSIYLLNESDIPSVLVEVGFISNTKERKLLESKEYQIKIAHAIVYGLIEYFSN